MPQKPKNTLMPLIIGDETLGQKIAECRKKIGITQQELADKIGITRQNLSNYENNRRHINNDVLVRLSIVLNVSIDYLVGLSDDPKIRKRKASAS